VGIANKIIANKIKSHRRFSTFQEQLKNEREYSLVSFNFLGNVNVSIYTSSDGNSCIQTSDQYDVGDSQD
jgi:hypothetical protein